MTHKYTTPHTYVLILACTAILLSLLGAIPADRSGSTFKFNSQDVPDLAGSWAGSWEDTRYFVSGDVVLTIEIVGDQWTANGTIDFTDVGMGVGIVPLSATGTLVGNTLTYDFDTGPLGSGSATLIGTVHAGTGTAVDPIPFGDFDMGGTASSSEISGTFDFTSPTGGEGTMILTRTVAAETASWSDVKASWR
jgi:hypothetical protein